MKTIRVEAESVRQATGRDAWNSKSTFFSVPGPYGETGYDMINRGVDIYFQAWDSRLNGVKKSIEQFVYLDATGSTYVESKDPYWKSSLYYDHDDALTEYRMEDLPSIETNTGSKGSQGWVSFGVDSYLSSSYQRSLRLYRRQATTGIAANPYIYSWPFKVYGVGSAYPPYLIVSIDEGSPVSTAVSPAGFIEREAANTFTWTVKYSNWPLEDPVQTSAALQWQDGEGPINSIAISGDAKSYTIPANTLPLSNTLRWRVVVNVEEGQFTSAWKAIRTADLDATVTALSPSGAIVDGSKPIRLTWSYDIATGTEQTKYDIQYKTVGYWLDLASADSSEHFADIPANTLPSGNVQWRVRAYNQSGLPSQWSEPLSIVVIAAPQAPELAVNVISPRPGISWVANDQQAYEVRMGEYNSGLLYGVTRSFKCPVYLPDGRAKIAVRVGNAYNLWSPWSEIEVDIANAPGSVPQLRVSGERDAVLSWDAVSGAAGYWIYRNGVKIAETEQTQYIDRYAIGKTEYFVRAVYDDDNYTDSPIVQAALSVRWPVITALDGEWIELRYTADSMPYIQSSMEQSVSLMRCSEAVYPVPERAPYRQQSYSINAAFRRGSEDAGRFEGLLGREVCVKDQYGNLIHGVVDAMSKSESIFYSVYTATIPRVEGEL